MEEFQPGDPVLAWALASPFADALVREPPVVARFFPSLRLLAFLSLSPAKRNSLRPSDRRPLEALASLPRSSSSDPACLVGLPVGPLVARLRAALVEWVARGSPPLPPPFFPGLFSELPPPLFPPSPPSLSSALALLSPDLVLSLLQLRRTAGSRLSLLPPPRAVLLAASRSPHRGLEGGLTVAGRALSKHAARCARGWWGNARGSAAQINAAAECALARIAEEAVWVNIHVLPPDERPTLEARVAEGYGARWTLEGEEWTFRGYLEPPAQDGHEKGWKH